MTSPSEGRRNPPRRCRTSQQNGNETLLQTPADTDSPSVEQDHFAGKSEQLQSNFLEEPAADSDPSEYEASDPEKHEHDESNSSDFEDCKVEPVRPKRIMKPQSANKRKKTKTKPAVDGSNLTGDEQSVELSAKQTELLGDIFAAFDTQNNGRITLSDILRVADDHGFAYGTDEARDMVRFWDTSGTVTISRETFMKLAVEAKFVLPSSK